MTPGPDASSQPQRSDRRSAFAEIVRRYRGDVYAFLRARLTDPAEAERLTERVFLDVFRAPRAIDGGDVLSALLEAARNRLHEQIRVGRAPAWTELCLDVDGTSTELPIADERLRAGLNALDPADRDVLEQTYGLDLSAARIGERLRRSESAVRQMLIRARQRLRRSLASGEAADTTS